MPSLKDQLTQLFSRAFEDAGLAGSHGQVILADRPDLADFQCNGALAAAKAAKRNPREIAQAVVTAVQGALPASELGADAFKLSIAGPGFINLNLSDTLVARAIQEQTQDPRKGRDKAAQPRKVIIDFGGPNVAKSMHVGHLRSSIIGDSLVRIYRFMGDTVTGDNHLGDWGTQMGMLICELRQRSPGLPYFDPEFKGEYPTQSPVTLQELEEMYPLASKKYGEDATFREQALRATDELQKGRPGYRRLWQHFVDTTVAALNADFHRLGIHFDTWLGESFYEERMPKLVEELKATGQTEVSEGALILPVANADDPEMPPVILVKSGGGFLYHTSDLATIQYRVRDCGAQLVLYVVDKRQSLHFKQVFEAARKTGLQGTTGLRHVPFGTMNGTDGKPFKTRSGGVLKLKDLIQMITDEARKKIDEIGVNQDLGADELQKMAETIGIATLKFADLKHNRAVDYVFDLEKFARFEGRTGPYLQYSTVRIKSILAKAKEQSLAAGDILPPQTAAERQLMLELLKFPDSVAEAYHKAEPHHLCDYGFNLSQAFNAFYKESHILREKDPKRQASWLALCKLCHDHLELSLGLLGIGVPERM